MQKSAGTHFAFAEYIEAAAFAKKQRKGATLCKGLCFR